MGLVRKIGKILGITLMAAGTLGTAAFGSLLGVGTNYTISNTQPAEGDQPAVTMKLGVGSLNYGKVWFNGEEAPVPPIVKQQSYQEFVNSAKNNIAITNTEIASLKQQLEQTTDENTKQNLQESINAHYESKKTDETIIKANKMMISGAVMSSIMILLFLTGIVLLIVALRKHP